MLLSLEERQVETEAEWAEERLLKHSTNEANRVRFGLETDLARVMRGETPKD